MIVMSNKQYSAMLNQARLEGYHQGYEEGRNDGLTSRFTINEIREIFGAAPIHDYKPKAKMDSFAQQC